MTRKKYSAVVQEDSKQDTLIYVVGIGSSAGGLEALADFFKAMPDNSGMAFVLVSHLDPRHTSMLPDLIQNKTMMKVQQITDNLLVAANQVYIIPPDKELAILGSSLQLMERQITAANHRPIDVFFRALAEDQGDKAVGIILSGSGTDGTLGIKAIKEKGGLILVQDRDSAKFEGMVSSACATGLADHIMPPHDMPERLLQYVRNNHKKLTGESDAEDEHADRLLQKIYLIVRATTGHDFSLYKKNTICRRIERRMHVHQLATIDEYVAYLKESEREAFILFKELLIGVTSFFRDPEAFDLLKEKYLPPLLASKPDDSTFRIWVPGCSSGEEVYSVAIIVQECLYAMGRNIAVQLFGTDLDEGAISVARAGIYQHSISIDVGQGRLAKFFNKVNDHYQIKKTIREMVVFAEQNVIKDPPFTKLDMLCCRNLLIYFGPVLQERLLPTFHYSLKQGGILLLGSSENIGQYADQFRLLDKKWKIFERRADHGIVRQPMQLPSVKVSDRLPDENVGLAAKVSKDAGTIKLLKAILKQSDVSVCVVVDDKADLIYAHGRTGRFLEPAEGETSCNILQMARPGLKAGLTNAIRRMSNERREIVIEDLRVKNNGYYQDVNLIVKPLPDIQRGLRGLMLIIFEEIVRGRENHVPRHRKVDRPANSQELTRLENELRFTRENLQTTIEELETSNEELKSTNEELQSANEELQSTNEEMETSKEELQSLNEEASTVNSELQGRIDELISANDDIKNLLDATDIAIIFLDLDLNIRRYTPQIANFFHLTPADIGRPIEHFASTLKEVDIKECTGKVLRTLDKHESVIEDIQGHYYRMRVRPFRTVGNVIEGIVITFEDVTEFEKMVDALQESEASWRDLAEHAPVGIFILTGELFSYINPAGREIFGSSRPDELVGTSITDRLAMDSREDLTERLRMVSAEHKTMPVSEKEYLRMDGSSVLCEVLATNIVYGGKKSIAVYLKEKAEQTSS